MKWISDQADLNLIDLFIKGIQSNRVNQSLFVNKNLGQVTANKQTLTLDMAQM